MTQRLGYENMETRQRWFINTGIAILIILVGGWVRAEIRTNINKDDIKSIRDDYMPYDAFINSLESNQKLINVITSIQSGNDERYQKALNDWNNLQQSIIKQSGKKKRGANEL
jgi:hypothetical protein